MSQMRIHVGMYSVFMREWLSVFPRSSFYILRTEDYTAEMEHHLSHIYNFLGLGTQDGISFDINSFLTITRIFSVLLGTLV